jgi:hypothetical protein
MPVSEEEKRRIIDLHFNQGKTIREISRIMGKSSHDITPVTKDHRIQLALSYALANGEQSGVVQCEQDRVIPNVKAYKLFDEGKDPLDVAAELNLPGTQVQQFYLEYLSMMRMHRLVTIYQETQGSMGYFLKLFRLGKESGVSPEQIIKLIQMANSLHKLNDKLQHLQREVLDISRRKTIGQEELKNLHKKIEATLEKIDLINKTFNVKYGELKETCSQVQKLQDYVEQFKDSQDYLKIEAIVRSDVRKILIDNRKLLQNALFSVLLALRNDPDRYFIVDRIELTPFTTTILNYNSFLGSRRPLYPQGSGQFSERVLDVAEKLFCNLQKIMVESTISMAAGLEEKSSYPAAYQALPYHNSPLYLTDQ